MENFEKIYSLYVKDVFNFLFKLSSNYNIAEELTQETFVKAFTNLNKFEGKCKLIVWLCQISKNLYFDYLKKSTRTLTTNYIENSYSDLEDNFIIQDTANNITQLIAQISEPYQTVLIDRLYLDLSYSEISAKFNKDTNWARVTFYRGKYKLVEMIKEGEL